MELSSAIMDIITAQIAAATIGSIWSLGPFNLGISLSLLHRSFRRGHWLRLHHDIGVLGPEIYMPVLFSYIELMHPLYVWWDMAVKRRQKNVDICRNILKKHIILVTSFLFIAIQYIMNAKEKDKKEKWSRREENHAKRERERERARRGELYVFIKIIEKIKNKK